LVTKTSLIFSKRNNSRIVIYGLLSHITSSVILMKVLAKRTNPMDIKLILAILTGIFIVSSLFFGTKNGFYDSDSYDGNGTAH
jgi:drug/metabolite transporter superfamily protein YnfA